MRASGHEQRVHKLVIAVERLVARDEIDRDGIGSRASARGRQHDVAIHKFKRRRLIVARDGEYLSARLIEIQNHALRGS